MEPLIFKGDTLIIDRSINSFNNKVSIVTLDGQLLCKRVLKYGGNIILRSENPTHKDIVLDKDQDFSIWGVVISIVRELIQQ